MAEKRRLQLEMEKCFKKIDEQLAVFDRMLESALQMEKNPAPTTHHESHREKMQDELKREIKKLQRLREHTKPYGNQGLSAEEKLDPRQKEKAETLEWLKTRIRKIKDEIDRTESKLEALGEKGGKRGKKTGDREESELKRHLERATFHVTNLEVCMRLITNEKLESAVVVALLKEPLDMYVEALEPENEYDLATLQSLEPDDVYAELELGDFFSLLNAGPPVEESRPPPPAEELEKTPLRSCVRLPRRRRRRRRVSAFTQTDGRAPSPEPAVFEPTAEMLAFLRAANADAVQRGYPADFFAFRPPHRLPTCDRHTQTWPQVPPPRLPPGWTPDTPEHYEKLDAGTLFYYFRNLTLHSCHPLVVRALQAKGWRLHSRLGSWFLRAGKPLEMGDGFERAPFHMFCFKAWDVKMIEDFCFEYKCIDTYY
ncbi:Not1 domain, CCR4-Not complex component [Aphelenchoides fujianensis]|nr:Not1 domain, CCR4-Not complex component [Aphelenchoides fujianensis]